MISKRGRVFENRPNFPLWALHVFVYTLSLYEIHMASVASATKARGVHNQGLMKLYTAKNQDRRFSFIRGNHFNE